MKTLLALALLSSPALQFRPPDISVVAAGDKHKGKGGHKDGGQKKDEEEEEDCRVVMKTPTLPGGLC